jgi:hypothetical protein
LCDAQGLLSLLSHCNEALGEVRDQGVYAEVRVPAHGTGGSKEGREGGREEEWEMGE